MRIESGNGRFDGSCKESLSWTVAGLTVVQRCK